MADLTININLDNDALCDDVEEAKRIVARAVEAAYETILGDKPDTGYVSDINGNTCCYWERM